MVGPIKVPHDFRMLSMPFFGIFLMTGGFRFGLRSGHGRLSDALGSDVYEASGIG